MFSVDQALFKQEDKIKLLEANMAKFVAEQVMAFESRYKHEVL